MAVLDRLLKKLGVTSYLDLNEEERATYKRWEEMLAGRKLTDDDVAGFFNAELNDTLDKLPKTNPKDPMQPFLLVKLEFLRKVQAFLRMPQLEKEALEASLTGQLEQM